MNGRFDIPPTDTDSNTLQAGQVKYYKEQSGRSRTEASLNVWFSAYENEMKARRTKSI